MLGESPAAAKAHFANWLAVAPWTSPEVEAHDGYARDHLHALLDRPSPPPDLPGSLWRALERLTWHFWRCFVLLQEQQRRLATACIA